MKGVFMYYVETYNTMNLPYQLKTKVEVTNLKIPGIFSKNTEYIIFSTPHNQPPPPLIWIFPGIVHNGNTMSMKNSSLLTS